jgi:hypothetical protein
MTEEGLPIRTACRIWECLSRGCMPGAAGSSARSVRQAWPTRLPVAVCAADFADTTPPPADLPVSAPRERGQAGDVAA